MLTWRSVQSESDPVLAKWLGMYERSFPREVLVPREVIAAQINAAARVPVEGDVLHVAAALDGDAIVGGAMFSFLSQSNLGFLSYIFSGPEARGRGVVAWVYRQLTGSLASDATVRGRSLQGIIFEVEREDLAATPREREERIRRLRFFAKVGAGVVTGIDYLQPPLHSEEEPLPMYLMFEAAGSQGPTLWQKRVIAWVEDAYRVIYVQGAGLSERVVADCLRQVRESMGELPVGIRRLESPGRGSLSL